MLTADNGNDCVDYTLPDGEWVWITVHGFSVKIKSLSERRGVRVEVFPIEEEMSPALCSCQAVDIRGKHRRYGK